MMNLIEIPYADLPAAAHFTVDGDIACYRRPGTDIYYLHYQGGEGFAAIWDGREWCPIPEAEFLAVRNYRPASV